MGSRCENEEKQFFCLSVRVWAEIVAWIQIIWYALQFAATQQQWAKGILMCLIYSSETCQLMTTTRQDPYEELLRVALMKLGEATIIIIALIEMLMGTVLLLGIAKKYKGLMFWWMAFAGFSMISPLVTEVIPGKEDIIPTMPRLLLKTSFYGTGIYIVQTYRMEISKRPDDKMHEKKACITEKV